MFPEWNGWMTAGLFALAVAGVRCVGVHKLPKTLFYWLWNVAALLFLLPVRVPSPVSVCNLTPTAGPALPAAAVPLPGGPSGLGVLLAVGAVLGLAVCGGSWLLWRGRFAKAEEVGPGPWSAVLPPTRRRVRLYRTGAVDTPCVRGVLRVRLYLPEDWDLEDREATRMALLHEWGHVVHLDNLRKAAFVLAVCLSWMNPAAWLMAVLASRDMELYSDAYALGRMEGDARRPYSEMLLTACGTKRRTSPASGLFGRRIRERVISIMKTKKTTKWTAAGAAACFIALVLVFATGAMPGQAEANHDADSCPACGGKMEFVSRDYGAVVNSGSGRICYHGHARYNDMEAYQDIYDTYSCTDCGSEQTYDAGRLEGWKCSYNYKFYPD